MPSSVRASIFPGVITTLFALSVLAAPPTPSCTLEGQVVHDFAPRAGALVHLRQEEDFETIAEATFTTGKDGKFRFVDLPAGFYRLSAFVDDVMPATVPAFECHEPRAIKVELELRDGEVVLEGRILDTNGAAIPGSEVNVFQDRRGTLLKGTIAVPVDATGSYRVWLKTGHKYRMDALAPGYRFESRDFVGDAREITQDFTLKREPIVHGVVVDARGTPVAGARVTFGPIGKIGIPPVLTADDGSFVVSAIADKKIAIAARSGSSVGFDELEPTPEGEASTAARVVLARGRTVKGSVAREDGTRQPFAEVFFRKMDLGLWGLVQADAQGNFVIEGLPQIEGVEVWATGGQFRPVKLAAKDSSVALTLRPPADEPLK